MIIRIMEEIEKSGGRRFLNHLIVSSDVWDAFKDNAGPHPLGSGLFESMDAVGVPLYRDPYLEEGTIIKVFKFGSRRKEAMDRVEMTRLNVKSE